MDYAPIENGIREALTADDRTRAATLTVEGYGAEVLGFLEDRAGLSDAEDVFANALEKLWTSLARYRGECSMRTWFYLLARRALAEWRRGPAHRQRRELEGDLEQLSALTQHVRSRTAPFQRTEIKNRARELRETLPDEDQQLLLLRLERGLSFREIAHIMGEDETPDDATLTRESARLRKRFQLAKERLTELLVSEGLVQED